jgi:hypothetical protein
VLLLTHSRSHAHPHAAPHSRGASGATARGRGLCAGGSCRSKGALRVDGEQADATRQNGSTGLQVGKQKRGGKGVARRGEESAMIHDSCCVRAWVAQYVDSRCASMSGILHSSPRLSRILSCSFLHSRGLRLPVNLLLALV